MNKAKLLWIIPLLIMFLNVCTIYANYIVFNNKNYNFKEEDIVFKYIDKKEINKNIAIKEFSNNDFVTNLIIFKNPLIFSKNESLGTYLKKEDTLSDKPIITLYLENISKKDKNIIFFHEYLHHLFYKKFSELNKEDLEEIKKEIYSFDDYKTEYEYSLKRYKDETTALTEFISYHYDNSFDTCYNWYTRLEKVLIKFELLPKFELCENKS